MSPMAPMAPMAPPFMPSSLRRRKTPRMKSPDNSSLVYTSPSLLNNDVRTIETCLSTSTNSQYVLRMQDSGNTAWLEVYGVNGNRTLKVMMTRPRRRTSTCRSMPPSTRTRNGNSVHRLRVSGRRRVLSTLHGPLSLCHPPRSSSLNPVLAQSLHSLNGMVTVEIALKDRFVLSPTSMVNKCIETTCPRERCLRQHRQPEGTVATTIVASIVLPPSPPLHKASSPLNSTSSTPLQTPSISMRPSPSTLYQQRQSLPWIPS